MSTQNLRRAPKDMSLYSGEEPTTPVTLGNLSGSAGTHGSTLFGGSGLYLNPTTSVAGTLSTILTAGTAPFPPFTPPYANAQAADERSFRVSLDILSLPDTVVEKLRLINAQVWYVVDKDWFVVKVLHPAYTQIHVPHDATASMWSESLQYLLDKARRIEQIVTKRIGDAVAGLG